MDAIDEEQAGLGCVNSPFPRVNQGLDTCVPLVSRETNTAASHLLLLPSALIIEGRCIEQASDHVHVVIE